MSGASDIKINAWMSIQDKGEQTRVHLTLVSDDPSNPLTGASQVRTSLSRAKAGYIMNEDSFFRAEHALLWDFAPSVPGSNTQIINIYFVASLDEARKKDQLTKIFNALCHALDKDTEPGFSFCVHGLDLTKTRALVDVFIARAQKIQNKSPEKKLTKPVTLWRNYCESLSSAPCPEDDSKPVWEAHVSPSRF